MELARRDFNQLIPFALIAVALGPSRAPAFCKRALLTVLGGDNDNWLDKLFAEEAEFRTALSVAGNVPSIQQSTLTPPDRLARVADLAHQLRQSAGAAPEDQIVSSIRDALSAASTHTATRRAEELAELERFTSASADAWFAKFRDTRVFEPVDRAFASDAVGGQRALSCQSLMQLMSSLPVASLAVSRLSADSQTRLEATWLRTATSLTHEVSDKAGAAPAKTVLAAAVNDAQVQAMLPLKIPTSPNEALQRLPSRMRAFVQNVGSNVATAVDDLKKGNDAARSVLGFVQGGREPFERLRGISAQDKVDATANIEQSHRDAEAVIDLADSVFKELNVPERQTIVRLARVANAVGTAAQLCAIGSALSVASVTGGLGAVTSLMGAFGPNPNAAVLEAIGALQADIANLHREMLEQFNAVFHNQAVMLERINEVLSTVRTGFADVQKTLEDIKRRIWSTNLTILAQHRAEALSVCGRELDGLTTSVQDGLEASQPQRMSDALKALQFLGTDGAKQPAFTLGAEEAIGTTVQERGRWLTDHVRNGQPLADTIVALQAATMMAGSDAYSPICNPAVWCAAVSRFCELVSAFPKLVPPSAVSRAKQLSEAGREFNDVIARIANGQSLSNAVSLCRQVDGPAIARLVQSVMKCLKEDTSLPPLVTKAWPDISAGPLPKVEFQDVGSHLATACGGCDARVPFSDAREQGPVDSLVLQSSPAEPGARRFSIERSNVWDRAIRAGAIVRAERSTGEPITWAYSCSTYGGRDAKGGVNDGVPNLNLRLSATLQLTGGGPLKNLVLGTGGEINIIETKDGSMWIGCYAYGRGRRVCLVRPIVLSISDDEYRQWIRQGISPDPFGMTQMHEPQTGKVSYVRIIATTEDLFRFLGSVLQVYRDWLLQVGVRNAVSLEVGPQYEDFEGSTAALAVIATAHTWKAVGDVGSQRPRDQWITRDALWNPYLRAVRQIAEAPVGDLAQYLTTTMTSMLRQDISSLAERVAIAAEDQQKPLRSIEYGRAALSEIVAGHS